ncbi:MULTISPECIES: TetR/AcrR family transcriptional regulator [unclassified Agrococcus]|uniref:TetR/AcrR family transcriptional regulator n=1 Tax=unclassified Agrococcus TaxID=2615065 RepID=UPI00361FB531
MVRPRRLDDDELLARIVASLEERDELTPWSLADVAPAAGMSPAGLVKRFGSKAGLLRALTRRWIERIPQGPLASGEDPAAALTGYVGREFGAGSPAGAVYALSEVLGELQDPELAALLATGWGLQARRLAQLLAALDLPGLEDPAVGGMLLLDALHGSLFRAAVALDETSPLLTLERFLEMWR